MHAPEEAQQVLNEALQKVAEFPNQAAEAAQNADRLGDAQQRLFGSMLFLVPTKFS